MKRAKVHPRAAEGERTKKEILRVARDLFAEKGYGKTTISDIAEKAHTYRSSVDWHFGSKEGMLLAVIEQFVDRDIPELYEDVGKEFLKKYPEPTHDQLMTEFVFQFLARLMTEHFNSIMTMYRVTFEEAPHNQELAEKIKGFWKHFEVLMADAIRDGQKNGTISADLNPEVTSRSIMAIEQGMFMQWYLEREALDPETTFSILINGIMRVLNMDPKKALEELRKRFEAARESAK